MTEEPAATPAAEEDAAADQKEAEAKVSRRAGLRECMMSAARPSYFALRRCASTAWFALRARGRTWKSPNGSARSGLKAAARITLQSS